MYGQSDHSESKPSLSSRRRETESLIVDAFEEILKRDGVRAVGVNSVVKQAGIGKGLLYKYFGGLPGLVRAWIARTDLWPDYRSFLKRTDPGNDDPLKQMKRLLRFHAEALRSEPLALEIMADELLSPSDLSDAFAEMRLALGQQHCTIFETEPAFQQEDNRALMLLLYAASCYLAMRARRAPKYMGFDLSRPEDWDYMMGLFDRLIERGGVSEVRRADDDQTPETEPATVDSP